MYKSEIENKKPSWLSYLPEIYDEGEDSFLGRYLSIFQELYGKMTRNIAGMPQKLYPQHADRDMMEWLAKALGMENVEIWEEAQLEYLLSNWYRLSKIRGTKAYMEELVKLFVGTVPYIVEYYQTIPYRTDVRASRLLSALYGDDPYIVTILLEENAIQGQQKAVILRRLVESAAPVGIECRLVFLAPCIYLDSYSYLGMNSVLAGYGSFRLDDSKLLPYRSMVGK